MRGSRIRLAHVVAVSLLAGALPAVATGCGAEASTPRPGASTEAAFGDPDGDARLDLGPGEALVPRTDLAPPARPVRTLALLAQVSDPQVGDEESPARVPQLDRLGAPLQSAFRPQEALTAQVLAATLESLEGLRPQAVVLTGDLIENAQRNELDQLLAVLRGGRVDPDSGARGYHGVQSARSADPLFYRPDVDAPRFPGMLARAQRPFRSPGLRAPWYPLVGNHDLLAQGLVRPTPRLAEIATGAEALSRLDDGASIPRDERLLSPELVNRVLEGGLPGDTERVPADRGRRPLRPGEAEAALRAASGHGGRGSRLDHSFDVGPHLRGIALDIVRRDQGSRGRLLPAQARWLRRELARAPRGRRIVVFSHQALGSSEGGEAALALLDRDPRVVAAVSGSSHRNSIRPRRSVAGGYWLLSTGSLVDHPQQARALRLVETAGGGAALETWMIDHSGRGRSLAGISRELAFVDAQGGRPARAAGRREDRNARLFLP